MSTHFDRLLLVQERDRKIAALEKESKDIPARKREIESRLKAHTESLEHAEEELKKQTAAVRQIEGEIDAVKQKIEKFRQQQFQIKSNEEYKALENEIATAEKEIRSFEDRELELMEKMEQGKALIKERQQDLNKEKKVVDEDVVALDKRNEIIAGEIRDLKVDRDALAADVEPDWLARYERIIAHHNDFAIVGVEHGACGGCHMKLPPQVINDAKKGLDIITCNYCGRILYLKP